MNRRILKCMFLSACLVMGLSLAGCKSPESEVSAIETESSSSESVSVENNVAEPEETVVSDSSVSEDEITEVTDWYDETETGVRPTKLYDNFNDLLNDRITYEPYLGYTGENDYFIQPSICIVDVNNDGRKDLVVNGVLGLRSKSFTDIILNLPEGLSSLSFDGNAVAVCNGYAFFEASDYDGAGSTTYEDTYVVKFDGKGGARTVLSHAHEESWWDSENETEYDEPKITDTYRASGSEVDEYTFGDMYNKYKEGDYQEIKYKSLSESDWVNYIEKQK